MTGFDEAVEAVIGRIPFGKASAAKRGRNPSHPYVPIIDFGEQAQGLSRTRTEQIRNKAFKDREEAVQYAGKCIEARKRWYREQFAKPGARALREQWGLPRELVGQVPA